MSVLTPNIFANKLNLITYNDICETLLYFICKNCKNIKQYHNTIPTHFNNSKTLQYSYIIKSGNTFVGQTNYVNILYNAAQNKLFSLILDTNIILNDIKKMFEQNNIFIDEQKNTIADIEDIIKCCFISLEFIKQNVLRVYFPLTDSYSLFYRGKNSVYSKIIPNFKTNTKDSIINTFNLFLEYFTSCKVGSDNSIAKENILYSFLYTITAGALSLNNLKLPSANNEDKNNKFYLESKYNNFHINLT